MTNYIDGVHASYKIIRVSADFIVDGHATDKVEQEMDLGFNPASIHAGLDA